jgi:hypothetical protein
MVQMKSMKWRNAYLLFYERKTPIEISSDDEEKISKQENENLSKVDIVKSEISPTKDDDVLMKSLNNT